MIKISHILPITGEASGIVSVVKDVILKSQKICTIEVVSTNASDTNYFPYSDFNISHVKANWVNILALILKIAFRKNRKIYGVVHLHTFWNPKLLLHFCMLTRFSEKSVIVPHGNFSQQALSKSPIKKNIYTWVSKFLLPDNLQVIALTDAEEIESRSVLPRHIKSVSVIPNFIETNTKLYPPQKTYHKRKIIKFLYVGRIDIEHKGIDLMLNSLGDLLSTGFEDFSVSIVGPNRSKNDEEVLQKLITKNKLEKKIEIVGSVKRGQLGNYYLSSDYLLMFSRYEGLPMVAIEALASGLPLIVTRETNVGGVIESNAAGYVLSNKNDEKYDDFKDFIFSSGMGNRSLRENAYSCFLQNFTWMSVRQKYNQLYNVNLNE